MSSVQESWKTVATGAGVIMFGTVLSRAFGFFGQILIVRSISPRTFGNITLALTILLVTARLATMGIPEGVTRMISAEQTSGQQQKILQCGFIIVILGSLVATIIVLSSRSIFAEFMQSRELPRFLLLFAPYMLLFGIAKVSIGVLRSQKQSLQTIIARDFGPQTGAVGVFLLFLLINKAVTGAVLYWILVQGIMALIALTYIQKSFSLKEVINRVPDWRSFKGLWSFSWPLAFESSFMLLLSNLDVLMIGYFLTPSEVGLYRAIQPLRELSLFILTSVVFLYLPLATEHFNRDDLKGLNKLYTISTKWIIAGTLPAVLVLSLFPENIIRIVFQSAYVPAAPALTVLILGIFFRSIVGPSGTTIKAINQPKVELFGSLIGVIVNIVFNILLIPSFGIVGAAAATGIGFITFNLIEVAVIYRVTGGHPFSTNNFKFTIPTIAIGILLKVAINDSSLGLVEIAIIGLLLLSVNLLSMMLTSSLDSFDIYMITHIERRIGIDLSWVKSTIDESD